MDNRVMQTNIKAGLPEAVRAEGVYVYDANGRQFIDCAAGIAVVNIGHGVKEVRDAMHEQIEELTFTYGGTFTTNKRQELADRIIALAPEGMDKVFFCSGGSEAMESMIKIARQYHVERGNPSKYKIISRWQSYHGNTLATLSIGGRPSWRKPYIPMLMDHPHITQCNCFKCPFGAEYPSCGIQCARELERVIKYEGPETISAFIFEPVTGTTAPAIAPPQEYFDIVAETCAKYDVLIGVDEVITGFGRTGTNFAVDRFGFKPDMIGFAKGLASGYIPIGGVILHKKVVDAIAAGSGVLVHSFTFAGNPLACATANAAVKYLTDNNLIERSNKVGAEFLAMLKAQLTFDCIGDIRGLGMLMGVELVKDRATNAAFDPALNVAGTIVRKCFEKGVMLTAGIPGSHDGVVGDSLQIAPPFVMTTEQFQQVLDVLKQSISETLY